MEMQKFKDALSNSKDSMNKNQLADRINAMSLEVFDSIDNSNGDDNSRDIIREELAELSQAVSKMIRFGTEDNWYHLLEEYADVLIALDIIKHIWHLDKSEIENAKYVKLHRLVEKIHSTGYIQ